MSVERYCYDIITNQKGWVCPCHLPMMRNTNENGKIKLLFKGEKKLKRIKTLTLLIVFVVMTVELKMKKNKKSKDLFVLDVKKIRFVVRTPNFVLNV
jgi:hypothetical protein